MLALDNIQGFLIQLACAGGSGAIAKTAVAPLERVKVRQSSKHCYSTCCTSSHAVLLVLGGGGSAGVGIVQLIRQESAV